MNQLNTCIDRHVGERERLEPLLHIAHITEAVVGDAPVGTHRAEAGEVPERDFVYVLATVSRNERRYKHIGTGGRHGAVLSGL